VRDESLQQAFSRFGTVTSAKVMMDRDTGRSKGFGFVESLATPRRGIAFEIQQEEARHKHGRDYIS
jgi:hypothetical protein